MDDVYSAFARKLGTTREHAKRRAYQHAYSFEGVEVLAPGEPVPAAVRLPQVETITERLDREGWELTTRAGQRFFVGYEVAYDLRPSPGAEVPAPEVLEAAFKQHRAVWLPRGE